jgi:outer membrane protein assembly factor BamA
MRGSRMLFRFGILTLIVSQIFCVRLPAQSNNCSSEDSARRNQIDVKDAAKTKIVIDAVELHGDNPLSEAQRSKLTEQIQQLPLSKVPEDSDRDWIEYAAESIREQLQEDGYFKAFIEPKPFLIRVAKDELHYVLSLDVESGPQYSLGNVRFKNNQDGPLVFGEAVLLHQLQLKSGDLFAVPKVRKALEGITKLYNSKGYVDMVPAPETDINEVDSSIDLTIRIDEGSPYRIGSIEILTADRSPFNLSELPQTRGDVFNHGLWSKFFEDGTLKSMTRNIASHTLEVTLDFRPCHGVTVPETSQSSLATRYGVILRTIREH